MHPNDTTPPWHLCGVGVSWRADFRKGIAAAERGNYATAMREWTPLAKQGNASAQTNLGVMYVTGQGIQQDYVRAHIWWNIAASSGDKGAVKNRDKVAGMMTPSQLEKAQDLARECIRKKYKGC